MCGSRRRTGSGPGAHRLARDRHLRVLEPRRKPGRIRLRPRRKRPRSTHGGGRLGRRPGSPSRATTTGSGLEPQGGLDAFSRPRRAIASSTCTTLAVDTGKLTRLTQNRAPTRSRPGPERALPASSLDARGKRQIWLSCRTARTRGRSTSEKVGPRTRLGAVPVNIGLRSADGEVEALPRLSSKRVGEALIPTSIANPPDGREPAPNPRPPHCAAPGCAGCWSGCARGSPRPEQPSSNDSVKARRSSGVKRHELIAARRWSSGRQELRLVACRRSRQGRLAGADLCMELVDQVLRLQGLLVKTRRAGGSTQIEPACPG